jgi:restriction endonuclease S subunit
VYGYQNFSLFHLKRAVCSIFNIQFLNMLLSQLCIIIRIFLSQFFCYAFRDISQKEIVEIVDSSECIVIQSQHGFFIVRNLVVKILRMICVGDKKSIGCFIFIMVFSFFIISS